MVRAGPRGLRGLLFSDLGQVVLTFLVVKAALYAYAYVAWVWVPADERARPFRPLLDWPWLGIWQQWDAGAYIGIAERGYQPGNADLTVFFPLMGWLMAGMRLLVGNTFLAGVIIANLAMLGAVLLLYRLALLETGSTAAAHRAAFYLLIFPSSFFTSTAYSEALFLLTTIGCFYAWRRGRWLVAGWAGMAAQLTRFLGIVLALVLAVAYVAHLRTRGWRPDRGILAPLLVLAGLGVYALILQLQMGDPLAPYTQRAGFDERTVPPWVSLATAWDTVQGRNLHPDFPENWARNLINLASVLLFLGLTAVAFWRLGAVYGLYMLLTLLLALSDSQLGDRALAGMVRFNLALFPGFILLGQWGARPAVDRLITVGFLLFLGLLTPFFLRGWSVAGVN